jgi:hypothetical protein
MASTKNEYHPFTPLFQRETGEGLSWLAYLQFAKMVTFLALARWKRFWP